MVEKLNNLVLKPIDYACVADKEITFPFDVNVGDNQNQISCAERMAKNLQVLILEPDNELRFRGKI